MAQKMQFKGACTVSGNGIKQKPDITSASAQEQPSLSSSCSEQSSCVAQGHTSFMPNGDSSVYFVGLLWGLTGLASGNAESEAGL